MTQLQLFILRTIHRHGPQSEAALWNHSKGETLPAVCRAIATLAEAEFIELTPTHKIPQRFSAPPGSPRGSMQWWQLTQKGSQRAAENAAACDVQQEVCLGSK